MLLLRAIIIIIIMYKTKLQEFCQRRSWPLPTYNNAREGPNHNPRFTSTVTVNGVPFHSPSPTRTAKQAQNDAAMLAFHHFSPSPLSPPLPQHSLSLSSALSSFPQPSLCPSISGAPDPSSVVDDILPMNGVLQPKLEVCQTSQISSPVTAVRETITAEDQKNVLHLSKNQLQSYVQKKNLSLPVYSPEWEGPPHAMRFKCKVTVDGHTYESDKFYSTLKEAEHAAAEVALMSLSPGRVQEGQAGLYKNLLQELAQKEGFRLPIYTTNRSGEAHMPIFVSQVEVEGELFTGQAAKSKKQAEMSAAQVAYMALKERKVKNMTSSSGNTKGSSESSSFSFEGSSPSHTSSTKAVSESSNMSLTAVGTSPCQKRVVVYSRKTNVNIEEGGTILPISDDKWVAYSYSQ